METHPPQQDSALLHRAGPARIMDVAERAGVSMKSVSRVINNEPHVTPKLRAKVEAAIRELRYVPDTAARSLAGTRSFVIGVLFDNPSPNYMMEIMDGAYRACIQRGYHLRIDHVAGARPDAELLDQLDAVLGNSRTDGFILTPPLSDDARVLDHLDRVGIRYVRVSPLDRNPRSPLVFIDDKGAAAEVAQHLWNAGHRRFGIITGPSRHGSAATRRTGFIDRLKALDPQIAVSEAAGNFDFASGILSCQQLLQQADRPTAIFAANDDMAAGAMVACAQAGLRVPQDLSVCGFDDSWVAKSVWPYLSTVNQPIADLAATAVDLLLDRNYGDDVPARKLPFKLVSRDSVGPPPAAAN
jgi:LacI family transcriptional regulator